MTTLMSDLSQDIPVRSFLRYTKQCLALKHTSNYGLTVSIQKGIPAWKLFSNYLDVVARS